jgi:hypothetical protein
MPHINSVRPLYEVLGPFSLTSFFCSFRFGCGVADRNSTTTSPPWPPPRPRSPHLRHHQRSQPPSAPRGERETPKRPTGQHCCCCGGLWRRSGSGSSCDRESIAVQRQRKQTNSKHQLPTATPSNKTTSIPADLLPLGPCPYLLPAATGRASKKQRPRRSRRMKNQQMRGGCPPPAPVGGRG